jgi:transcriptional regulator NrdR family protein
MPRPKSVTRCRCGGRMVVEYSNNDAWYVRRSRACDRCGQTESTVEIPAPMLKTVLAVTSFVRRLRT